MSDSLDPWAQAMDRLWAENRNKEVQVATGIVYILATEFKEDMCKIGFTTRTVQERIRELNAETGSLPFHLYAEFRVVEHEKCEKIAHDAVREYQIPGKELFLLAPSSAYYSISQKLRAYCREEFVFPTKKD